MKKPFKGGAGREAMGSDPVWRLLFPFSGPAIVSMTVASTYNLVDAVFVGRLGPTAPAAMSVTFPLVLSFIAVASGTAVGATSLISRSLGAGDHKNAGRAAGVAITLCFLLSAAIAVICLCNLDAILGLLGAGDAVLPLAKRLHVYPYLFYYFLLPVFDPVKYHQGRRKSPSSPALWESPPRSSILFSTLYLSLVSVLFPPWAFRAQPSPR